MIYFFSCYFVFKRLWSLAGLSWAGCVWFCTAMDLGLGFVWVWRKVRTTETEILLFISLHCYRLDVRVCLISEKNEETKIEEMFV